MRSFRADCAGKVFISFPCKIDYTVFKEVVVRSTGVFTGRLPGVLTGRRFAQRLLRRGEPGAICPPIRPVAPIGASGILTITAFTKNALPAGRRCGYGCGYGGAEVRRRKGGNIMREDALWRLAEVLLPLRDDMRALRGEVDEMRGTIHGAQQEIHRLRDEVLGAQQHTETEGLREELHRAQSELKAFRNELRCIRALAIRQKYSLGRIAGELERFL